jgi:hypothetical protein
LGWLCFGNILAASVFVIWRLVRGSGFHTEVPLPGAGQIITRTVSDGFWIDSPGLPAGAVIRYRCAVDGIDREDRFTIGERPSGLFVYTGGTPAAVQILEVIAGPRATPRPPGRSRTSFAPSLSPKRQQPMIDTPPRPMFPSAY